MRHIPRITTRGYYDLGTGARLKDARYHLHRKGDFDKMVGAKEMVVMVHGLRNDSKGAATKALLARQRLRKLGYMHPVAGYSYDSNTTGAHLARHARHALVIGQKIAKKNGRNLGMFVADFKAASPRTKIRLMGHSLGSQVILSTLEYLAKSGHAVESVHLFGASIPSDVPSSKRYGAILQHAVNTKIANYFAPTDEVLGDAESKRYIAGPLGLHGAVNRPVAKYSQARVRPQNHRFASYIKTLRTFP